MPQLVISGGDPPEAFDFIEEPLHTISLPVKLLIKRIGILSIGFVGYIGNGPLIFYLSPEPIG